MIKISVLQAILWILVTGVSFAQEINWQNGDLKENKIFGVSTKKAYSSLLKGKKSQKVIVAVIDSGIDTAHVDLKAVLWTNPAEIPGNGIDDDHNGYVDDIHGWNFTGLPFSHDSLRRLIEFKKPFYDSLSYTGVPPEYREGYQQFRKVWKQYEDLQGRLLRALNDVQTTGQMLDKMEKLVGSTNPSLDQLQQFRLHDSSEKKVLDGAIEQLKIYPDYPTFKKLCVDDCRRQFEFCLEHLTSGSDSANIVASHVEQNGNVNCDWAFSLSSASEIFNDRPVAFHGTHIAGIIAADHANQTGMDGIADRAVIMPVKFASAIDRLMSDENLAAAIRYAADNGARVINLSMGGISATANKKLVDEAVRYAMQHNVLIVHAAGNDGKNIDGLNSDYPNPYYLQGDTAAAWITVGASGWKNDSTLCASFSNYSRVKVDVFAPGVQIYSTAPGSTYERCKGTSYAAPVVCGVAALLWEYYPKLTASQVKDIIMRSVVKSPWLTEKCVSGGVVNAYNALELAEKYSGEPGAAKAKKK